MVVDPILKYIGATDDGIDILYNRATHSMLRREVSWADVSMTLLN